MRSTISRLTGSLSLAAFVLVGVVSRAGDNTSSLDGLPIPPTSTRQNVAFGAQIFNGEASGGRCSVCHGTNGAGGGGAPKLTTGKWLWSDGSLAGIEQVVRTGVTRPKKGNGSMPPRGGAPLSDAKVAAVSSYVWAISHQTKQQTSINFKTQRKSSRIVITEQERPRDDGAVPEAECNSSHLHMRVTEETAFPTSKAVPSPLAPLDTRGPYQNL